MALPDQVTTPALAMLPHCLYELRKGVRQLFLLTMQQHEGAEVQKRLHRERVAMHIQDVNARKLNVYFGQVRFVEIAKRIAVRPLNQLSPEEDFMLGILLGYERGQQCQRYLARVRRSPRHARLRRDLANTPPCAWPAPQAPSIKLHE